MRLLVVLIPLIINLSVTLTEEYYVIATSGLNLREEPNSNSSVMIKIGYGEMVVRLGDSKIQESIEEIHGNWLKVKYKDYVGYVFDPFLLPSATKFPTKKVNKDYALLLPACTCYNNFQYEYNLKWFGLYINDPGICQIKPISYSYHRQKATIGDDICISTINKTSPNFIIGSKKDLTCENGTYKEPYQFSESFDENEEVNRMFYYDQDLNELIYCFENRDIDLSQKDMYPQTVNWRGDLNQDGIDDLIIEYGVKELKLILILSTIKNSKIEFIKVAEFYNGYCC